MQKAEGRIGTDPHGCETVSDFCILASAFALRAGLILTSEICDFRCLPISIP
jgi:hypothetical protein